MFFVYIIFSKDINQYYVGETHDLIERLIFHKQHTFSKAHTTKARDWKYKWCLPCTSRSQARKMETFIKKMKSRRFIEQLMLSDSTWLYQKFPE